MNQKLRATGKCLCEKVSMTTADLSGKFGACHCVMCRKWGGSAFLSIGCGNDLEITGSEYICVFKSSEWANRAFCRECGTHLYYEFSKNQDRSVPLGFFDNTDNLIFSHQIFTDMADKKYSFQEDTVMMTEAETFARYASKEEK
jgi:hypothetical protein